MEGAIESHNNLKSFKHSELCKITSNKRFNTLKIVSKKTNPVCGAKMNMRNAYISEVKSSSGCQKEQNEIISNFQKSKAYVVCSCASINKKKVIPTLDLTSLSPEANEKSQAPNIKWPFSLASDKITRFVACRLIKKKIIEPKSFQPFEANSSCQLYELIKQNPKIEDHCSYSSEMSQKSGNKLENNCFCPPFTNMQLNNRNNVMYDINCSDCLIPIIDPNINSRCYFKHNSITVTGYCFCSQTPKIKEVKCKADETASVPKFEKPTTKNEETNDLTSQMIETQCTCSHLGSKDFSVSSSFKSTQNEDITKKYCACCSSDRMEVQEKSNQIDSNENIKEFKNDCTCQPFDFKNEMSKIKDYSSSPPFLLKQTEIKSVDYNSHATKESEEIKDENCSCLTFDTVNENGLIIDSCSCVSEVSEKNMNYGFSPPFANIKIINEKKPDFNLLPSNYKNKEECLCPNMDLAYSNNQSKKKEFPGSKENVFCPPFANIQTYNRNINPKFIKAYINNNPNLVNKQINNDRECVCPQTPVKQVQSEASQECVCPSDVFKKVKHLSVDCFLPQSKYKELENLAIKYLNPLKDIAKVKTDTDCSCPSKDFEEVKKTIESCCICPTEESREIKSSVDSEYKKIENLIIKYLNPLKDIGNVRTDTDYCCPSKEFEKDKNTIKRDCICPTEKSREEVSNIESDKEISKQGTSDVGCDCLSEGECIMSSSVSSDGDCDCSCNNKCKICKCGPSQEAIDSYFIDEEKITIRRYDIEDIKNKYLYADKAISTHDELKLSILQSKSAPSAVRQHEIACGVKSGEVCSCVAKKKNTNECGNVCPAYGTQNTNNEPTIVCSCSSLVDKTANACTNTNRINRFDVRSQQHVPKASSHPKVHSCCYTTPRKACGVKYATKKSHVQNTSDVNIDGYEEFSDDGAIKCDCKKSVDDMDESPIIKPENIENVFNSDVCFCSSDSLLYSDNKFQRCKADNYTISIFIER